MAAAALAPALSQERLCRAAPGGVPAARRVIREVGGALQRDRPVLPRRRSLPPAGEHTGDVPLLRIVRPLPDPRRTHPLVSAGSQGSKAQRRRPQQPHPGVAAGAVRRHRPHPEASFGADGRAGAAAHSPTRHRRAAPDGTADGEGTPRVSLLDAGALRALVRTFCLGGGHGAVRGGSVRGRRAFRRAEPPRGGVEAVAPDRRAGVGRGGERGACGGRVR
mmetsp:Transcript_6708/g.16129  ORF Transcript_6708/g.16129 Transcript_6708/m.16129 type:complete len:220 (+) Transcript_6708:2967-3626(+)